MVMPLPMQLAYLAFFRTYTHPLWYVSSEASTHVKNYLNSMSYAYPCKGHVRLAFHQGFVTLWLSILSPI